MSADNLLNFILNIIVYCLLYQFLGFEITVIIALTNIIQWLIIIKNNK
jgi:hypothetical protein